ncbi:unnamed protein product, partial [Discosporangium mesarthrocarpum]
EPIHTACERGNFVLSPPHKNKRLAPPCTLQLRSTPEGCAGTGGPSLHATGKPLGAFSGAAKVEAEAGCERRSTERDGGPQSRERVPRATSLRSPAHLLARDGT